MINPLCLYLINFVDAARTRRKIITESTAIGRLDVHVHNTINNTRRCFKISF